MTTCTTFGRQRIMGIWIVLVVSIMAMSNHCRSGYHCDAFSTITTTSTSTSSTATIPTLRSFLLPTTFVVPSLATVQSSSSSSSSSVLWMGKKAARAAGNARKSSDAAAAERRAAKKPKDDVIEVNGVVLESLPNAMFRVAIDGAPDTQEPVLATISGKIRKNFVKILVGDIVTMELSPYDLTRGRITFRMKK